MKTNVELNENEIEFIEEVVTQITEAEFGEHYRDYAFNREDKTNGDFYNERYDEIETLYINLIKRK